jgi:hypothetical protein
MLEKSFKLINPLSEYLLNEYLNSVIRTTDVR